MFRTVKIKTTQEYGRWVAIDENSYDGAPDSINCELGVGQTEQEAINDLLEQIEEADVMDL